MLNNIGCGGLKHNYEGKCLNYATGEFGVKVELQSFTGGGCGYRWDSVYHVTMDTNGAAKISSYNNGANYVDCKNGFKESIYRSYDTVFKSSDYFHTDTDNVMLEVEMSGLQGNTYIKSRAIANNHTVTDWKNILNLIATPAVS